MQIKYTCPYCKTIYSTQQEAETCGQNPATRLSAGDILNPDRFGRIVVQYVEPELGAIQGYSAGYDSDWKSANALSYAGRPAAVFHVGALCVKHSELFMTEEQSQRLVDNLTKRLRAAQRLHNRVQQMWIRKRQEEDLIICK